MAPERGAPQPTDAPTAHTSRGKVMRPMMRQASARSPHVTASAVRGMVRLLPRR
jgi:hypothetical protein